MTGSVPLDTESGRAQLQDRLGLFARLGLALGLFFFVAVNAHRAVFFGPRVMVAGLIEPANVLFAGVMGVEIVTWIATRRGRLPAWALVAIDGALTVGTLAGRAVQLAASPLALAYGGGPMMLLVTYVLLLSRAVIVPSSPRATLVVSALGTIPVMAVAVYLRKGGALETASFTAIWCIAAVGLSTFTSRVIYGLRARVAKATQLGQYVLEEKLGEGGMGEVYRARHRFLRRPTAVKLLPPDRAGADTVARFEREVHETSLLSHPNTVAIYDFGRTREGVFYYAMEYLDGADLQRLVEKTGPLSPSRVVHVLAQIAGALAEAHGLGLVHRDMKPANVVLCERGGVKDVVKVVDFGLVKHLVSDPRSVRQTAANALVGTPAYMAPEAIRDPDHIDGRADLYAVGAIGYFLLTGREVFEEHSIMTMLAAHLHDVPVPPSARGAAVPADLESVLMQCLAKDPGHRPPSARALRDALLACDVPAWNPDDAHPISLAPARSSAAVTLQLDVA